MKARVRVPSERDSPDPRRVLVVFLIYVYIFVWLIVGIFTKYTWLNNLLRPYLPDWALLVIGLSAPITATLVGLRAIPWKVTKVFLFILPVQGALFGLVAKKYPYVGGAVTVLLFFLAYLILPEWNRRILEREGHGTTLHLK